ncbi:MAG TPA: PH domain-containing protein [Lapillicoccus sp.]|nr:PH domain-containing protein [Lapillicoccus sp.]
MSRSTSAPEALRTLRQRGSIAMGIIAMVVGGFMAVLSVFSGDASLLFIGVMLLLVAVGWVLFIRPSVVLTVVGIELDNPFRRTTIPWSHVEDVSPRWNLEIWAGGKAYPAWAIASHIERPKRQGIPGYGKLDLGAASTEGAKPSEGATVGSASRLIETALAEYAQLLAEGDSAAVTGREITREWNWLDIACFAVPVAVALVGLLT